MRLSLKMTSGPVLLSALALAGCGSSGSSAGITVAFTSPAIVNRSIPAQYTCDGRDIALPLEWGAVPAGVSQLAMFILGLTPNPSTGGYKFTVEWAVAGVNPGLHKLAAGKLPPGAHVGLGSDRKARYSICPARGGRKLYQFALYSVPSSIVVPRRFVGMQLLHAIATPNSVTAAHVAGAFLASYKRR